MVNYFYDCYAILCKVYSDKTYIKQAINSTIIEEKNRALTIKTCYGVLDKDIELSYYIKQLTDKSPKLAIKTILKISMYAIKYLNKQVYAVTKNAVELVKKLGKGGVSGFVNAFLRKFISSNIDLPADKIERLSVKYSYPLFTVKKIVKEYGVETAEKILSSENKKTTLVFYETNGEEYLSSKNIEYELTPFNNVFTVKNFVRNDDFDKGIYTFQALGSVAICDVVKPSKFLLDCCSAPGGKSVRLSRIFDDVYACDIHSHRVDLINEYTKRMHRDNVKAFLMDSKVYNPEFDGFFDAVLCDAPCSGLGVVNDNPDIKLNREESAFYSLLDEQKNILQNVSKYVKVGGCLYYSTCSILKEENDLQIKKFIIENSNFTVQEIESPLPSLKAEFGLQFLPHISGGLGFYVAKLKRER